VLASLYGLEHDGHTPSQRELADHTGLEPLYVSKLARSLDADGLIQRTRDAVDTRAVRLELTTKGRETIEPAIADVAGLLDKLLAPLGGRRGARTAGFVRDLIQLLDTPL
jgi:DNA-binding MarR family transcriptional regulator